jgi:hypothetical protein
MTVVPLNATMTTITINVSDHDRFNLLDSTMTSPKRIPRPWWLQPSEASHSAPLLAEQLHPVVPYRQH